MFWLGRKLCYKVKAHKSFVFCWKHRFGQTLPKDLPARDEWSWRQELTTWSASFLIHCLQSLKSHTSSYSSSKVVERLLSTQKYAPSFHANDELLRLLLAKCRTSNTVLQSTANLAEVVWAKLASNWVCSPINLFREWIMIHHVR